MQLGERDDQPARGWQAALAREVKLRAAKQNAALVVVVVVVGRATQTGCPGRAGPGRAGFKSTQWMKEGWMKGLIPKADSVPKADIINWGIHFIT